MALYDVSTIEKKSSPELVAGGTLYADNPIGTILPYGGTVAPNGWFLCQGQAVSRTDYSELFQVIGTSFGAGDGSTTFNIPDMRESVPKGAGLTGKTVGAHLDADGLAVGEFLDDRFQEHKHRYETNISLVSGSQNQFIESAGGTGAVSTSTITEGRYGVTTEVKSVGVNYIIKAKQIGIPADFLAKVDETIADEETRAKAEEANLLSKIGNYGKDALNELNLYFRSEFQASFDAAANYSLFYGGTEMGVEGGWIGFKHTSAKCGAIIFNANGIYFIFKNGVNWNYRQIF